VLFGHLYLFFREMSTQAFASLLCTGCLVVTGMVVVMEL
jgi:hypothetical protein